MQMTRQQRTTIRNAFLIILLGVTTSGCFSTVHTAVFDSSPEGVTIRVNGNPIGTTPIQEDLVFSDEIFRYRITASKEGYYDQKMTLHEADLLNRQGRVLVSLESYYKDAVINSNPPGANIRVGNDPIGRAPVEYKFNFSDRGRRYLIVATSPGYLDNVIRLDRNSPQFNSGIVEVAMESDPSWTSTAESEATNTWLRIQVNAGITHAEAWQKVIDSVTSVYDSLEQLDQSSGYLRSTAKIKEFESNEGPIFVRTQLIGSIASTSPLTYKIKIQSKTRKKSESDQKWVDFDRVFSEDSVLVEELLSRLGLK